MAMGESVEVPGVMAFLTGDNFPRVKTVQTLYTTKVLQMRLQTKVLCIQKLKIL